MIGSVPSKRLVATVTELRGEVAERYFVHGAAEAERRVAAYAATLPHGESFAQLLLGDAHLLGFGEARGRVATEQPR
jgi:hypothetical protein